MFGIKRLKAENESLKGDVRMWKLETTAASSRISYLEDELECYKEKEERQISQEKVIENITQKANAKITEVTEKLQKSTDSYLKLWDAYNKIKK